MVKIKFFLKKSEILGFEVIGHTAYAEKGQDIVCSAISVLAQTAILGLGDFLKKDSYSYDIKDGYLSCKLQDNLPKAEYDKAQIVLRTVYLGMKSIEKEYKMYVKILEEV